MMNSRTFPHRQVRSDDRQTWQLLKASPWLAVREDGFIPDFPAHDALIVPIALWRLRRDDLAARPAPLGILLTEQDDPGEIAADLDCFTLIAVQFDLAAPARATAVARVLRASGYRGELWAVERVETTCIAGLASADFDVFALTADTNRALMPIDILPIREAA